MAFFEGFKAKQKIDTENVNSINAGNMLMCSIGGNPKIR
jgi:hypothetical protein